LRYQIYGTPRLDPLPEACHPSILGCYRVEQPRRSASECHRLLTHSRPHLIGCILTNATFENHARTVLTDRCCLNIVNDFLLKRDTLRHHPHHILIVLEISRVKLKPGDYPGSSVSEFVRQIWQQRETILKIARVQYDSTSHPRPQKMALARSEVQTSSRAFQAAVRRTARVTVEPCMTIPSTIWTEQIAPTDTERGKQGGTPA
jgi:hypothetical protein